MADNGDDTGETEDTGRFVFGEERTTDGEHDIGDRLADGTVVAAIILVALVVVVVAAAAVVQPFGSGSGGAENKAPDASAGTTTAETDGPQIGTGGPTATTTIAATATTTSATQTATATPTATPATTETATPAESKNETGGNETETATATDERSPVIETFSVTDRSSGGAAIFDVAWNVTDPNSDLVAVQIVLVADPDGEAQIIERRRFDASGAQSAGSTTFEIPDGGGEVYELRIVAEDGSGNTVFSLTRAVADGSPDE